jgi:hypothetical protein
MEGMVSFARDVHREVPARMSQRRRRGRPLEMSAEQLLERIRERARWAACSACILPSPRSTPCTTPVRHVGARGRGLDHAATVSAARRRAHEARQRVAEVLTGRALRQLRQLCNPPVTRAWCCRNSCRSTIHTANTGCPPCRGARAVALTRDPRGGSLESEPARSPRGAAGLALAASAHAQVVQTAPSTTRGRISGYMFGDYYWNAAGILITAANAAGADSGR